MATPPDLLPTCTMSVSGDVTMNIACRNFLCHPPGIEDLNVAAEQPSHHGIFDIDGGFAVRSYAGADLRSFDVGILANGFSYGAQPKLAGSSVALTITHIVEPNDPCSGVAEGTAQATLVQYDPSTGAVGNGRLTVTITF